MSKFIKPDIVDTIQSEGVELKQHGNIYVALCPFSQERTPSFTVYPKKQRFVCFGACQKKGDVVDFIRELRECSFKEALAYLKIRGDSPGRCKTEQDKRDLLARYKKWERETFISLAEKEREWGCRLSKLNTIGKLYVSKDKLLEWQIMNYHLDILQHGSEEEKFELFKNGGKLWKN